MNHDDTDSSSSNFKNTAAAVPQRVPFPVYAGEAHVALREVFESTRVEPAEAARRRAEMAARVLASSKALDGENFNQIATADVANMLAVVDETCFARGLQACIDERGATLAASLSTRMTRTGGKTIIGRCLAKGAWRVEVRLATTPLFRSFCDDEPTIDREITVNGVRCETRLTAALAVIEHEALHVAEFLCYGDSACHKPRFQQASKRLFGHESHQHQLVSSLERAHKSFGVLPGSRVAFTFDGKRLEGRVSRIVKRATVLVPDAEGVPYSDGQTYRKYYVPLPELEPLDVAVADESIDEREA